ncbi:MAG: S26 family signal peptidase [Spirochaetales bacterium]|jgi:signal peptidase I|nr:S26 family signal peptidase [Spirochaetales bacterium]
MEKFLERLLRFTESWLTLRKIRRRKAREKQKKRGFVRDWAGAFIWAACVVLLVNQYLLQAYQIPSGSMMNTLLVDDRIFVNKGVFGPELLPGMFKLPGFADPRRGEVIIFENPSYLSRGPVFDIFQRILYMLTFSFVDIDKDEAGRPKAHFLIKRAVAMEYDFFRQRDGNLELKPRGEDRWYSEKDFQALSGMEYPVRRLVSPEDYPLFREAGIAAAHRDMKIPVPSLLDEALVSYYSQRDYSSVDESAFNEWRIKTLYAMNPHERRYGSRWRAYTGGTYVPRGRILPLGDNRDNSRDGRYFGTVPDSKILGRAMFRYYPLNRLGNIR